MPAIYAHHKPNYRLLHFALSRKSEIKKEVEQLQLEDGLMDQIVAMVKRKACPSCGGECTIMAPIPGCECDGPRMHTCPQCNGSGDPKADLLDATALLELLSEVRPIVSNAGIDGTAEHQLQAGKLLDRIDAIIGEVI